ncbi:hypothetical protein Prudu_1464S001000, partial [Prunus dulcis]
PSSLSPLKRNCPAAFQSLLEPLQGSTCHGTGGDGTAVESPTFPDPSPQATRPAVACTRHPPPGHLDFRAFWIKSDGM